MNYLGAVTSHRDECDLSTMRTVIQRNGHLVSTIWILYSQLLHAVNLIDMIGCFALALSGWLFDWSLLGLSLFIALLVIRSDLLVDSTIGSVVQPLEENHV